MTDEQLGLKYLSSSHSSKEATVLVAIKKSDLLIGKAVEIQDMRSPKGMKYLYNGREGFSLLSMIVGELAQVDWPRSQNYLDE